MSQCRHFRRTTQVSCTCLTPGRMSRWLFGSYLSGRPATSLSSQEVCAHAVTLNQNLSRQG